jgi:sulfite exporter TauE/SafE
VLEVTLQGLLLGLATGLSCLGYCGPIYIPLMMAEKRGTVQTARVIAELALGRLVAYLLFGAAIGYIGGKVDGPLFQRVMAGATVLLSLLLLVYVTTQGWPNLSVCRWVDKRHLRFPVVFGFLSGFNVCPPFLLAISYTFGLASIFRGMLLFCGFFAGTSVYLLLLLPLGYLGRWQNIRLVGLMTAVLAGIFFLFVGVIRFVAL